MAGRRGRDEGSIYERSDGRWAASVSLGYGPDGKRSRKSVYGKTRKEVADKLKALQATTDAGFPPTNDSVTVAQLATDWLSDVVKPKVRPRTFTSYSQMVRSHVVPKLGRNKVAKVDTRSIQTFLKERGESGLSPQSVRYLRMITRQIFGQAVRWGYITRNPVDFTDAPKVDRPDVPNFSKEQAKALLSAFSGHRLGALFTSYLGLGLRMSEALGCRWQDVEVDDDGTGGSLTVRMQLQWIGGKYELTPPKSASGRRRLALPKFVATALLEQRNRQAALSRSWASDTNPLGLVFTTDDGTPLNDSNVRRDFYKLLANAEMERLRVHDLRHLCASLLAAQNVHPRIMMSILGHSQISLTLNRYSHLFPTATQEAADQMDAALKSP